MTIGPMDDRHAGRRFALSLPPPEDERFAAVRDHIFNTVTQHAMRLRRQCAAAYGISIFDTVADIVPDPDRPNFITITARPRAINDPFTEDSL